MAKDKLENDRAVIMAKLFQYTSPSNPSNQRMASRNTSMANIGKSMLNSSILSNNDSRAYENY